MDSYRLLLLQLRVTAPAGGPAYGWPGLAATMLDNIQPAADAIR